MSSDFPTIIVWGAGSFGPLDAAAPNNGLQKLLSCKFPVILCSEYDTSPNCHTISMRTSGYKRRSTVLPKKTLERLLQLLSLAAPTTYSSSNKMVLLIMNIDWFGLHRGNVDFQIRCKVGGVYDGNVDIHSGTLW
jgi:hypothetical protein